MKATQLLHNLGQSIPELESKTESELGHDSSTNNLIRRYRKMIGSV
jgi:hypothetical protein